MIEKFYFLATAFALLALTCATAGAQEKTSTPQTSNEQTAGTISGTVVNERGEPMPGASVFLRALGTTNAGRTTAADGEGRFRVNGLEAGLYVVTGYSLLMLISCRKRKARGLSSGRGFCESRND